MTDRRYHVIVRNDRTNTDTFLTATSCTHDEACIILSKVPPVRVGRAMLREVEGDELDGVAIETPDALYYRA